MSDDQFARSAWILLALVLVASGLVGRRLPQGRIAVLAVSWIGIIIALWAAFSAVTSLR